MVISRSQEREGSGQRPCADPSHDVELGAVASRCPTYQQARAERTIGAAAGNCEETDLRPRALLQEVGPSGFYLRPLFRRQRINIGRSAIAPVPYLPSRREALSAK